MDGDYGNYTYRAGYSDTDTAESVDDGSRGKDFQSSQSPSTIVFYESPLNYSYSAQPMQPSSSRTSSISTGYDGRSYSPNLMKDVPQPYSDDSYQFQGGEDDFNSYFNPLSIQRYPTQPQYLNGVDMDTGMRYNSNQTEYSTQPYDPGTMLNSPSPRLHRVDKYQCIHPGCDADAFSRNADLARHVKHVHGLKQQLDQFWCDYKTCERSKQYAGEAGVNLADSSPQCRGAFTRKDHYKAHLREYHREPLPKRSTKDDPNWIKGKNVKREWWRCLKCLTRVWIKSNGDLCPNCKTEIDKEVKEARRRELSRARAVAEAGSRHR